MTSIQEPSNAGEKIRIMGILNLTPDSFYDGGKYSNTDQVLSAAEKMLDEGADIIDVGGYSSRPGATHISPEEEESRVIPVLKDLTKAFPHTLFSIDTFRASIAEKAVEAGAHMINDISAGELDETMFPTVAKLQVPYILMHMKGNPRNMQKNPKYENIIEEINSFFQKKISCLNAMGVEQIIIDPGFGFGKTLEDNYLLLHRLGEFKSLGYPLLAGISRKSMLYKALDITPSEALHATAGVHMLALLNGASYLRVHDVKEAVQIVKIFQIYAQASERKASYYN